MVVSPNALRVFEAHYLRRDAARRTIERPLRFSSAPPRPCPGGPIAVHESLGVAWSDQARVAGHPAVRKRVEQIIEDRNGRLQSYARIKKFAALPAELSEEAGEVTPSQKLKRKRVAEKYADVLESLYQPCPARTPAQTI
jgi:long-subunit acyl-CoA synthetase (AMP-forming)